jgi:hypothetical protein
MKHHIPNLLKSTQVISCVNVELKTNISLISIIKVNMVTYTSLSNQCLILLAYYAAGGYSQTMWLPIQLLTYHYVT